MANSPTNSRPRYSSNPTPRKCHKGRKMFDGIDYHIVYEYDLVINDDGVPVDSRNKFTWDERYDLDGNRPFTPDAQGTGITFANGQALG